jgi:hypothetical protein
MKISRSLFLFAVFAVCLAIPPLAIEFNGGSDWLTPHFWLIFFFITGLTLAGMIIILLVQQRKQDYYIQGFMASTTIKILASMIFVVVFLMKNKVNKGIFLADFFYIYLFNMVFEIYVLMRNLRHQKLG